MAQKYTKIILNIASDINGMPFKYDWANGRMEVFANPMRVVAYKLHALLCWTHVSFHFFQLQRYFKIYTDKNIYEFYLNTVIATAYAFVFGFHTHVLLCMREISNAMNQFHCLNQQFQGKANIYFTKNIRRWFQLYLM